MKAAKSWTMLPSHEKTHRFRPRRHTCKSKSALDSEMATLLTKLLGIVKVAIISGGNWPQFEKQVLANLPHADCLENLSLLPTCGTKFYEYVTDWKQLYSEDFTVAEKEKIIYSLQQVSDDSGFKIDKLWGEVIEDRASQITFPLLGSWPRLTKRKNGMQISPSESR